MFLRHVLSSEWGRARGDKSLRASAFPGTISARKVLLEGGPAHASPGPAAEKGANAYASEATERHENAGARAPLERKCAVGIEANRFA